MIKPGRMSVLFIVLKNRKLELTLKKKKGMRKAKSQKLKAI